MRSDLAAFQELDTLVRALTEQLASYRKRALAAESRARDLERAVGSYREEARTARADVAAALHEVEAKVGAVALAESRERTLQQELNRLRGELADADASRADAGAVSAAEAPTTSSGTDDRLADENERLRAKLTDARTRTVELLERVRFLRQQVGQKVER